MDLTRVAKTAAKTLSHTFYVDEVATDSTTTVTVSILDANGATVSSGNATHAGPGAYTFALPPQASLAQLTVSWSATITGAAVVETDPVEVVGGFFFGLAEARGSDASLADITQYPTAALAATRLETEQECERICERAFVPRYKRVLLDGTGTSELMVPDADIRTIRSVTMAPRAGQTFVPLTAAQLAALVVTSDRMLRRVDDMWWTEGLANVLVEYEYGLDGPPKDLKEVALIRFRSLVNKHTSGVPDRAESFTSVDGGTYRLSMPGRFTTGIPDVDAVYARYALGSGGGAANGSAGQPASRQLQFDPQYLSMWHGGVR